MVFFRLRKVFTVLAGQMAFLFQKSFFLQYLSRDVKKIVLTFIQNLLFSFHPPKRTTQCSILAGKIQVFTIFAIF